MSAKLDRLFQFHDLRNCTLATMHVVMATRLTTRFMMAGRDPLPDLAVRLRSVIAARRIEALVVLINDLWPEPFLIHRPCCMMLSPDEGLLAQVTAAAAHGDHAGGLRAVSDFLPNAAGERLFRECAATLATMQATQKLPISRRG